MRSIASIAFVLALGCAADHHGRYLAEHPGWFPVGPSPGMGVAELVASLTAPPPADIRVLTQKLTIFRTDVEPWEEHDIAELASGSFTPLADASHAVIHASSCRASEQLQSYFGTQTSWYMFANDKLLFWDHGDYSAQCVLSNEFFPARVSYVAVERAVTAKAAKFPKPTEMAMQTYRKGIVLVAAGRVEDAEAMLELADAQPDSGGESDGGHVRFDGPRSIGIAQQSDRQALRAQLVHDIATAKAVASH